MTKGYVERRHIIEACQECHNREEGRIHVAEVPVGAIEVEGAVGQDLMTGARFITAEVPKAYKHLEKVKVIVFPA